MQKETHKPSPTIVFFDGVCNLCNGFIVFLIQIDKNKKLKVASLQGEHAKRYLHQSPERKQLSSIILYKNNTLYLKSDAVIHLFLHLGGGWKILGFFLLIPKFIRNFIYDLIAKYRYSLFGKKNTCRLPTESEKDYFLD